MASSRASIRKRPIFIQAMWRTSSTYFWEKFRAQPQYRAYYEPLHEMLIKPRQQVLSIGGQRRTASLRHPPIDRSYFAEFPFAGEGGVEFFEKALAYERYCLNENGKDDALRRYISNLIAHASRHKQRAVLQFNRSLLRSGWLTRNFALVNILVLRKPVNVRRSFLSFSDGSFTGVFCIALGQNKSKWPLNRLPDWLDLPCRIGPAIEDDYAAYGPISAELTPRMYPSFFDFSLVSTLHAARYANCILDVDETSANPAVKAAAQRRLRDFGVDMDFSDCSIPSYELSSAKEREWLAYEDFARCFLRATLPQEVLIPRRIFNAHRPMLGNYFRELLSVFAGRSSRSKGATLSIDAAVKHSEGIRLLNSSNKQSSATVLGEALSCEPASERWNDWASAHAASSRLVLAELGYRQALKMDRWNGEAAENLGAVLAALGRKSEALPLLEQAERADPSHAIGERSGLLALVRRSIGAAAPDIATHRLARNSRPTTVEFEPLLCCRPGITVFFTGLSGAGKSTLTAELRTKLLATGVPAITVLDGDDVRSYLSSELGFSKAHRDLNIRRVGFVAAEVTRHGGISICAAIAPFDEARKQVRAMVESCGAFVLVHVATPLATCERRDAKGLYAKARAGLIPEFTGISDPYEEPLDAEIRIDTSQVSLEDGTRKILEYLTVHRLLPMRESVPTSSTAPACYGS